MMESNLQGNRDRWKVTTILQSSFRERLGLALPPMFLFMVLLSLTETNVGIFVLIMLAGFASFYGLVLLLPGSSRLELSDEQLVRRMFYIGRVLPWVRITDVRVLDYSLLYVHFDRVEIKFRTASGRARRMHFLETYGLPPGVLARRIKERCV